MKLGFIDPFIINPAIHCFNGVVDNLKLKTSYHMPSRYGVTSLHSEKDQTDAWIIVGSASHVTEGLEWQRPLADVLLEEMLKSKPILGCCFGHQLLCHALGSEVDFHSADQSKHEGLRPITITRDQFGLKKGEVFKLPVTHRQVVKDLKNGLIEIGVGLGNDIVAHEKYPVLLTQAHPEASEYFCTNDIKNLSAEDISLGRSHGAEFIRRFFLEK